MGKEQRKAPRAEISLNVEIRKKGSTKPIEARVVNLSKSGAFIETKAPADIGDEFDLVIFLDKKLLKVSPQAKVIYSSKGGSLKEKDIQSVEEMRNWLSGKMRDGWGVMFTAVSEEDEKLLNAFVIAVKD